MCAWLIPVKLWAQRTSGESLSSWPPLGISGLHVHVCRLLINWSGIRENHFQKVPGWTGSVVSLGLQLSLYCESAWAVPDLRAQVWLGVRLSFCHACRVNNLRSRKLQNNFLAILCHSEIRYLHVKAELTLAKQMVLSKTQNYTIYLLLFHPNTSFIWLQFDITVYWFLDFTNTPLGIRMQPLSPLVSQLLHWSIIV